MKIILPSLFVGSLIVLTGCVDSGGYRDDPGFRSGGYSNDRWRERDYHRDRDRDRDRWRPDRPDRNRDPEGRMPESRNTGRGVNNDNRGDHGRYDFMGRDTWQQDPPIIRPRH